MSVAQLCPTLCEPMHCSPSGSSVCGILQARILEWVSEYFLPHFREVFNYYLLKYFLTVFLFVFFFWDPYDSSVVAFNILCRPLLLLPPIPPSIRVFSNESTLRMRWPKY